jgi:chemotaxis-related protein WspB
MLALCFRANGKRYAIAAREVVEVLPRKRLRELVGAPKAVLGLLPFRGMMVPVVDVSQLLGGLGTELRFSSRLIVVEVKDAGEQRFIALQADDVTDLVRANQAEPGLNLANARYLGEHLVDIDELPQLLNAEYILPQELRTLFFAQQNAANAAAALVPSESVFPASPREPDRA